MFLSIDDNVPEKGETKAARRRQETLDMILPNPDMYPGVEKQSGLMGLIVWQGREHPLLGDAPHHPTSPPIFLCHLCIFLLIVASPRRNALAALIPESDDHVT